jgi:hypothetical protein
MSRQEIKPRRRVHQIETVRAVSQEIDAAEDARREHVKLTADEFDQGFVDGRSTEPTETTPARAGLCANSPKFS